ncbi:MAG: O-antigen ligase family protein [Planctomycetota bacterium]
MSKGFKLGLFATVLVFFYIGTWFDFAKRYTYWFRWAMLAAMCLSALSSPRREKNEFAGGGLRALALTFAFLTVFSSAWSRIEPVYTLQRGLSILLLAGFLTLGLWPRLKSARCYLSVMNILIAVAWLVTLANLAVWVGGHPSASRWPTGAVQGVLGNPNALGMMYAILIPLTLGKFHYRKSIWNAALLLAGLLLLYKCQSRAGWVGTFLGVCTFYAGYYGRRLWGIVLILCLGVFAFVFLKDLTTARNTPEGEIGAFEQAMMRGETDMSQYGSGRIPLWLGALEKWKERPFVGYGFGTAGDTYYAGTRVSARFHSSLIQITAELGIVGLFFFIAPLGYSVHLAVKTHVAAASDPKVRPIIAGLAAGWFGAIANSFFESWLFSVGNVASILAWICFFAAVKGMTEVNSLKLET